METKPTSLYCATGITATTNVVASFDGLSKLSQLVLDIFTIIEHTWMSLCTGLTALAVCLKSVVDITNIVKLIKQFRDWVTPNEEGKMAWNKAWQSLVSKIGLTGYHALAVVAFLATTLKVITLGAALTPLIAASSIFMTGFAVFDLWSKANKLKTIDRDLKALVNSKEKWSQQHQTISETSPLPQSWISFAKRRNDVLEIRRVKAKAQGNKNELAAIADVQVQWKKVEKCSDPVKVKQLCKSILDSWEIGVSNMQSHKTKTWITMAFNIALIALSVFSTVAAFVTPAGLAMTFMLAIAITTRGFDLSKNFAEELLKPKPVPETQIATF